MTLLQLLGEEICRVPFLMNTVGKGPSSPVVVCGREVLCRQNSHMVVGQVNVTKDELPNTQSYHERG